MVFNSLIQEVLILPVVSYKILMVFFLFLLHLLPLLPLVFLHCLLLSFIVALRFPL